MDTKFDLALALADGGAVIVPVQRYETLVKTEVTCEMIRDYVAEEKDRFGDFDVLRVILGIKAEKESE